MFQKGLRDSDPDNENRDQRILNINNYFTYAIYKNVCRSLFEKDKLLLSFTMVCRMLEIDPAPMRFLLTGGIDSESVSQSPLSWLPTQTWKMVHPNSVQPSKAPT